MVVALGTRDGGLGGRIKGWTGWRGGWNVAACDYMPSGCLETGE